MGAEGLRLLFKARTVDGHVTTLTPVHTGNRLIKVITIKLIQHDLVNLRDLIKREEFELINLDRRRRIFHDGEPFVPLGSELG